MSGNTKKFKTKNGLSTQNVELVSTTTTFELQANQNTVGFSSNNTTLLNLNTDETGVIFSVNDASETPFIEVESDGDIRLAEVQGKVLVGFLESQDANTKLQVEGGISTDTISLDSLTAQDELIINNTVVDADNYERARIGWSSNVFEIDSQALGSGVRRPIRINYTTTINGNSRTNVPALTITNVGAGNGGLEVGGLWVGHGQDRTRIDTLYIANRGHSYKHAGVGVANQGAHRFTSDNTFGSWVGALGSVVDILAPSTISNIFQCRQSNETVVLNVAYDGAVTHANTVTSATESITLATTTQTQIASFPVAGFRSAKLVVQAYDAVTGEVQISELLVAHNGTTTSSTEYGVVFTGANPLAQFKTDISSGVVRVLAQRTVANSTQYKIQKTLMIA
jgi:hypothetical protein